MTEPITAKRTCARCGEPLTPIREIGDDGKWVTSWMHTYSRRPQVTVKGDPMLPDVLT